MKPRDDLSERERELIKKKADAGVPTKEIARHLGRNPTTIWRHKKGIINCNARKNCGRKSKITPKESRLIRRLATVDKKSLTEIVAILGHKYSRSSIRRNLVKNNVIYKRKNVRPRLTDNHKKKRKEFAKMHIKMHIKTNFFFC